jgi:hypothetical protein
MRPSFASRAIVALFLLASVAVMLQGGSVPHVHQGREAAFFNAEHDLTLLAGLAAHALPADTPPLLSLGRASAPLPDFSPPPPPLRLAQSGESRAPPAA